MGSLPEVARLVNIHFPILVSKIETFIYLLPYH